MNAGGSPAAQDFTTRYCDMNFVILKDRTYLEGASKQIAHLKNMARAHGRETRIWIHVYVVCRTTEKEAKDYLQRYVYEQGDWEAAGNLLRIFGMQTETLDVEDAGGPQGALHRRPRRLSAGRHRRADRGRTGQARRHRRRWLPDLLGGLPERAAAVERGRSPADGAGRTAAAVCSGGTGTRGGGGIGKDWNETDHRRGGSAHAAGRGRPSAGLSVTSDQARAADSRRAARSISSPGRSPTACPSR